MITRKGKMMVSLKKQKELVVEHLLTEEQTIAAAASSSVCVEVQHTSQPPAVIKSEKDEDENYFAAFTWAFAAFTWAIFAIFALLFVFSTVLEKLLPDMSVLFQILELMFGSMMLGTLIVNIKHMLHIDL